MKKFLLPALIATVLFSCDKDKKKKNTDETFVLNSGLLVLNEGSPDGNNASITYYDAENDTVIQDLFFKQNERKLGSTANDLLVYGGKIYISVGGSSQLEVCDLNLKSIRQIPLFVAGEKAREPHGLACHNGKVYVALFDGNVARIDTSTLNVDYTAVGRNPENICTSNGFAYVTNSGGLDWNDTIVGYDRTVSVIDLNTFTEVKKIDVGINPFSIGADEDGNIIVGCRGNYGAIPFTLQRINASNHEVYTFANVTASDFAMYKSTAYFYSLTYNSEWAIAGITYTAYNTKDETEESFSVDKNLVQYPYAINVNSENENVYISDAGNFTDEGKAFVFNKSGVKQFDFVTGIAPRKIVVLKK